MTTPTRPVLRWHGGKWLLAPWIISHFPPHLIYVEPFGGGASVLMRKSPLPAEIYNDLDDAVVNVFRVLRDRVKADELKRRLELTPFARAEFELSYLEAEDDVDAAHKTLVLSFMGFGSDSVTRSCRTGFRSRLSDERALPAQAWRGFAASIPSFVDRFMGVLVEQLPANVIIPRFDTPRTLFYVDPPYPTATRSSLAGGRATVHGYRHELTDVDHLALIAQLKTLAGFVVLSTYPSTLYDAAFDGCGWRRVERQALADGARPRTEVLWLNPACAAAIDREQLPLLEVVG